MGGRSAVCVPAKDGWFWCLVVSHRRRKNIKELSQWIRNLNSACTRKALMVSSACVAERVVVVSGFVMRHRAGRLFGVWWVVAGTPGTLTRHGAVRVRCFCFPHAGTDPVALPS
ncbi:hypothetical protein E2C01_075739 [Portunus trituberculatus]|uniref:Uncharacterized protein n=1 Tax=Portunus trituberculatus TaxID=210409 RepID=A0A5B7IJY7_PORTR|nr:hypothetical protein [Portunus trituberculatus]